MTTNGPVSPWMDAYDGAEHIRCLTRKDRTPSRRGFKAWAKRRGIVPVYRGGVALFARRDVDAVLQRGRGDRPLSGGGIHGGPDA